MGNWRIVLFGFYMLGQCAMVQALEGIRFQHKDWELACDNTGTCRMAGYGYSEGEESYPASLYIERKASNEALIGLARVEEYSDDEKEKDRTLQAQLWVDQRDLGIIKFDQKDDWSLEYFARLNSEQIHAIIHSLANKSSQIEFKTPKQVWKISDQGVAAVMLKADEFQKRINTPSAFLKKGKSQDPVLEKIGKPIVNIPKFTDQKQIFKFGSPTGQRLLEQLKSIGGVGDEGCSLFHQMTNIISFRFMN